VTSPARPPALAEWLLRRLLPLDRQNEAIRGDLLEEFRRRPSTAWYWREALSLIIRGHGYKNMLTLDNLLQDLRFARRSYAKAPAFTALVVMTLALGIGASTAIFSIVNGILLRPLPFPDPGRLMWISESNSDGASVSVSWPNFLDWRARQRSFEGLALSRHGEFTLTGGGQARRVVARTITGNFFQVVGVQPSLGRGFRDGDDTAGAEPVAIVSHEFWRRQLNQDPAALGRALDLGEFHFTVVGVLPAGFRYLRDYDLFVAMGPFSGNANLNDRGNHQGFTALGRLKPGVSEEAAASELQQIERDLARQYPDSNAGLGITMSQLQSRLVNQDRATLLVLFGAVGILLVIACVNVANLLIARGATRHHELAVRAALGGRRSRLLMQLLVESSVVSAAGGALGVLLGTILLRVLLAVAPEETPRLDEVSLDTAALLFATAAAIACAVLFGAFPAAQASSVSGQQIVIRTRSAGASAQSHRLRRGLLIAEVALALVLLAGAGLMVRTLGRLTGVDTGFRADHLLTMRLRLPPEFKDDAKRVAVAQDLIARLRALPGVATAGAGLSLPIDGSFWNSSFTPRDKPVPPSHDQLPSAAMIPVSETYFDALGTRLMRGRVFTAADTATSAPVAVINEALAKAVWPGENPIGKVLKQGWPERPGTWREVVGVIGDMKFEGLTEATTMQMYMPFAQDPPADFAVLVRTAVDPASMRETVEAVAAAISPNMPVSAVRTMEAVLSASIARQRMALLVLAVFAGIALVLAASGLYGLVAHSVTERSHEIGVRVALGAERADVLRLVIRHGLSMTLAGVAVGSAGAAALSGSLEGLVFGVDPLDPATFGAVALVLVAVSLLACYVPARRAMRIEPVTALRAE
jgi:putative ABC transport system permease protein